MSICEHCGQPRPETRLGVRLPPLKARIFDIVKRAGRDGIDRDELFRLVFGDRKVKRSCLKAHIWQINDLLEDSGYRLDGLREIRLVVVRESWRDMWTKPFERKELI